MAAARFSCSRPGVDGYPPYVRGWFRLAQAGSMQRGYRDVGYLLGQKLRQFRPSWLGVEAWGSHLNTLWGILERQDQRTGMAWLASTYPGLVDLLPAEEQQGFFAGMNELGSGKATL
jgi:hypothetical protein